MARGPPWFISLLLASLCWSTGGLPEDPSSIASCPTKSDDVSSSASSLLQAHRHRPRKTAGVKDRWDMSCYHAASDAASRDATCYGDLVCARQGYDNRNFGDCPDHHCCSVQEVSAKDRYDTSCWVAGSDMVSRDASCQGDMVCAQQGYDNRFFGDCPNRHCCSVQVYAKERYDTSCWDAGSDMASRDASCQGDLVCAKKGYDNRFVGDCPALHCCSLPVTEVNAKERYDTSCWAAGTDMASRDASCQGDLVCAKKGYDNRFFGDCPDRHCCSLQVFAKERYDTSCWEAGSDMTSRDATCQGDLVCAKKGHDNRFVGDCPDRHCCSLLVTEVNAKERYDTSCWAAGTDMASRDSSCQGDLVCAKEGSDNRFVGDCPDRHCCSLQVFAKERYDTSCWHVGSDMASRDASCQGDLVCAKKGYDNRFVGDCPDRHCCSVQVAEAKAKERYDTSCWAAGTDMASRDASCQGDLVCAKKGHDNIFFGDCPDHHCCSLQVFAKERYDSSCWAAGTDMASRDASCLGDLVCAKKGYDNRFIGDCPDRHCCSLPATAMIAKKRYDASCWAAGTDMASRDASCLGDLVCAKKGYDNRFVGDCPDRHCCSLPATEVNAKERYDTSCWAAGTDMASRDATCTGDLVCAQKGYDNRFVGDCPDRHCCSLQAKERFDTSCWKAGSNTAERDASCREDLVCARYNHESRAYGDCPGRHCCSMVVVEGKAIYGVGKDQKVYKQLASSMRPSSTWLLAGMGPMMSIAIDGDTIFGVGDDNQVYKQSLRTMSTTSPWTLAAKGKVISLAIDGGTIYGVGSDKKVYKQSLSVMTPSSAWAYAGKGNVDSIAIDGDTMYSTGTDHVVYKQLLSSMTTGQWSLAAKGEVKSITIDSGNLYGTGMSKKVWRQALSKLSPSSEWVLAGSGHMVAVAITQTADPGRQLSLAAHASARSLANSSIEQ